MRFGNTIRSMAIAVAAVTLAVAAQPGYARAANVDQLQAVPLGDSDTMRGVTGKPVKPGALKVPTITWGGDVATVFTDSEGIFKKEGLTVTLQNENDFAKQVKGVCEGETPFLRGTFGMINAAAEAMKKCGTELVVLNQLTWSSGGDALVVRGNIKTLKELKGKTIALQLYGPHMDLLTTVLNRAGLKLSDVKIVWLKELTPPSYDTKGHAVDPRTAFKDDATIDAAFVISPDAAALTDNGTGSGAEGVKGASVLFSTKTLDHVIADVYAVRKDWYDANKATAQKFVHAMMVGQESFLSLNGSKANNASKYQQLLSASATLLFDSPNATSDVEGAIGDAAFVGFTGNVAFFTGTGTTRNFEVLKLEIQKSFIDLKLMKGTANINNANWDYNTLTAGLTNVDLNAIPKARFNQSVAQQAVETQIATETATWDEEGSLYKFELLFDLNQVQFDATRYSDEFKQVLELSQTAAGAVIIVEGHNGPELINKMRSQGKSEQEIAAFEQAAKTVSLKRAQAVRAAFIAYAKAQNVTVDESQFVAVGMGVKLPKFATPRSAADVAQNRRVVFRLKSMETETDVFQDTK